MCKCVRGDPNHLWYILHWKGCIVKASRVTYADPGVIDGLVGGDPLGGVNGQHLIDQVLGLWGHCVPLWRGKLKRKDRRAELRICITAIRLSMSILF